MRLASSSRLLLAPEVRLHWLDSDLRRARVRCGSAATQVRPGVVRKRKEGRQAGRKAVSRGRDKEAASCARRALTTSVSDPLIVVCLLGHRQGG